MTPSEAQIKEACDLLDYPYPPTNAQHRLNAVRVATERAEHVLQREQHEAAMQRVSEIAKAADDALDCELYAPDSHVRGLLRTLILPEPTPMPEQVLAEAVDVLAKIANDDCMNPWGEAQSFLAKRGHHVAPIKDTHHD